MEKEEDEKEKKRKRYIEDEVNFHLKIKERSSEAEEGIVRCLRTEKNDPRKLV